MDEEKKVKELTRLFEYLIRLELSEQVCVFIDVSGHIGQISFRIVKSKDEYTKKLYSSEYLNYAKDYSGTRVPASTITKRVSTIISEVDTVVHNLREAIEKEEERIRQEELDKLEELRKKYEV